MNENTEAIDKLTLNAGMVEQAYKLFLQEKNRNERNSAHKLKSKKRRRALAKKAHKSRVRNK